MMKNSKTKGASMSKKRMSSKKEIYTLIMITSITILVSLMIIFKPAWLF